MGGINIKTGNSKVALATLAGCVLVTAILLTLFLSRRDPGTMVSKWLTTSDPVYGFSVKLPVEPLTRGAYFVYNGETISGKEYEAAIGPESGYLVYLFDPTGKLGGLTPTPRISPGTPASQIYNAYMSSFQGTSTKPGFGPIAAEKTTGTVTGKKTEKFSGEVAEDFVITQKVESAGRTTTTRLSCWALDSGDVLYVLCSRGSIGINHTAFVRSFALLPAGPSPLPTPPPLQAR